MWKKTRRSNGLNRRDINSREVTTKGDMTAKCPITCPARIFQTPGIWNFSLAHSPHLEGVANHARVSGIRLIQIAPAAQNPPTLSFAAGLVIHRHGQLTAPSAARPVGRKKQIREGTGRDRMRWDGTRRDEMGLDGTGRGGMRWNGTGEGFQLCGRDCHPQTRATNRRLPRLSRRLATGLPSKSW